MKFCRFCNSMCNDEDFEKGRHKCKHCRQKTSREYYLKNRKLILEKFKIYYKDNKEKFKKWSKDWREKNKEKEKINKKEYLKIPKNKITAYLRNRLNALVSKRYKYSSILVLIGCSKNELFNHLESQFKLGMSWDNYGKWHIDHIKPCAKFDLTKESEQKKCFNYKNLQPLWAEENLSKGSKYD